MRNQSISKPAIAAFALLIALDCFCAGATAEAKTHRLREKPHQLRLSPVHFIKCAGAFDGSPCWPDPAMLRLNQPSDAVRSAPLEQPEFAPSR
jgi:hypothetical protein